MNKNYRVCVSAQDARNGNIGCLYAADDAAWIWHPAMDNMVEFELEWQQENAAETVFFISAGLHRLGKYRRLRPSESHHHHGLSSADIP